MHDPDDNSTDDETPIDWKATAQEAIGRLLRRDRGEADEEVRAIARELTSGETPSAEDLHRARKALRQLQITLEEEVAPTVDGAEPYERAADHIPYSELDEVGAVDAGEVDHDE